MKAPEKTETSRRKAHGRRRPDAFLVPGIALLLLIALYFAFRLGLGGSALEINGLDVHIPHGFERAYADGRHFVWRYGGNDKKPGPLVIDAEIKGSSAQLFATIDDVLAASGWLRDAEIYVNPYGIRMVRGYSTDYTAGQEYRYYVETPKNVLLICMNEDPRYYRPEDCRQALLDTADGIRFPAGGRPR